MYEHMYLLCVGKHHHVTLTVRCNATGFSDLVGQKDLTLLEGTAHLHYTTLQYSEVQCSTMQYSTVQRSKV